MTTPTQPPLPTDRLQIPDHLRPAAIVATTDTDGRRDKRPPGAQQVIERIREKEAERNRNANNT